MLTNITIKCGNSECQNTIEATLNTLAGGISIFRNTWSTITGFGESRIDPKLVCSDCSMNRHKLDLENGQIVFKKKKIYRVSIPATLTVKVEAFDEDNAKSVAFDSTTGIRELETTNGERTTLCTWWDETTTKWDIREIPKYDEDVCPF